MKMNEYQAAAGMTAFYPGSATDERYAGRKDKTAGGATYLALKLAAEAGEVAQTVAHAIRSGEMERMEDPPHSLPEYGDFGLMSPEARDELHLELGDVLWYLAMMCDASGTTLEDVAQKNIEKLRARHGMKAAAQ